MVCVFWISDQCGLLYNFCVAECVRCHGAINAYIMCMCGVGCMSGLDVVNSICCLCSVNFIGYLSNIGIQCGMHAYFVCVCVCGRKGMCDFGCISGLSVMDSLYSMRYNLFGKLSDERCYGGTNAYVVFVVCITCVVWIVRVV